MALRSATKAAVDEKKEAAQEVEETLGTEEAGAAQQEETKVETKSETKSEAKPAEKKLALRQDAGALATTEEFASLVELKDAMDPADFSYGDLPRIVATQGALVGTDKLNLGTWIDVQVLSFSERVMISPGSDEKTAKEHVRASYDGKTITHSGADNGRDVDEYLQALKDGFMGTDADGKTKQIGPYPKAAKKDYYDIFGLFLAAEKADNGELMAQEGIVDLSMSPQSKGKFNAYAKQLKLTVLRGLISPEKARIVRFTAVPKNSNDRDFTLMVPKAPPREVSDSYEVIDLS